MIASRAMAGARRIVGIALLGALVAILVGWPELMQMPLSTEGDGRFFYHQIALGKVALLRYHELPLWNAFDCRGLPQWDHPEAITASPLLYLLVGVPTQITCWLYEAAHSVFGFVGMWLLLRDEIRLSRRATFCGSVLWAGSAAHTMQCFGAHYTFLPFYLAPLLVFLFRRATRPAYAIGLGITVAAMIYEGATYPAPFCAVMLTIDGAVRCLRNPKNTLKIIGSAVGSGIVAIGLAAPRILPLVAQMRAAPRVLDPDVDALSPALVRSMYTMKQTLWSTRFTGQQYSWHEYNAYVGYLLLAIALCGVVLTLRKSLGEVAILAVLFAFMLGHIGTWAPWTLLHSHVPPFTSMRVPSRFRLMVHAWICVFVAKGIDALPTFLSKVGLPRLTARGLVAAIALLGVGEVVGLSADEVSRRYQFPGPAPVVTVSRNLYYGTTELLDFIDQPKQNQAWSECRNYGWKTKADAPIWTGDVPQVRVANGNAEILTSSRTPSSFTAVVEAKDATRLVFNSASWAGWRTNIGTIDENNPLVAVMIPPGHHELKLHYWPIHMTGGIVIALVTWIGILLYATRKRWLKDRSPASASDSIKRTV